VRGHRQPVPVDPPGVELAIAMVSRVPSASGSQGVTAPVEASNAARWFLVTEPLTVVKPPPAYTVERETASDMTARPVDASATPGSKAGRIALVRASSATRFRRRGFGVGSVANAPPT